MKARLCHYSGCNLITTAYYCCKHEKLISPRKIFEGTKRKKSRGYNSWYHSSRWRAERKEFLKEHPYCFTCGDPANTVDHIRPHRGDLDLFWNHTNWQSMCQSCHSAKTLKENGYFGHR